MPVDVGTAADPATAPELPEWITNNLNNDEVVEDLGITFVDGVPVVTDQDDEADTPHVIDETSEEVEDDTTIMAMSMPENLRFQVWRSIHFNSLHWILFFVRCSRTCRCVAPI